LIVAANVIEHYYDPYLWLNSYLMHSENTIIIIPWNEMDVYPIHEGHTHHCRVFDDESFQGYSVIEEWKFDSPGWTKPHSKQWALLFEGKLHPNQIGKQTYCPGLPQL